MSGSLVDNIQSTFLLPQSLAQLVGVSAGLHNRACMTVTCVGLLIEVI